jgi:uncharacterized RDD family membrane protein YckC
MTQDRTPPVEAEVVEVNPYRSPSEGAVNLPTPPRVRVVPGQSSGGRFIAAQIDHAFGVVIFLAVGMNLGEVIGDIATGTVAFGSYLGYYFLPEWLFGTTVGKSLFSLRVRQLSGARCTARQAAIRTVMRLIEVNPLLLGALPAGISILATEHKQRLGDLLAGTVVVHQRQIGKSKRPARSIEIVRRGR